MTDMWGNHLELGKKVSFRFGYNTLYGKITTLNELSDRVDVLVDDKGTYDLPSIDVSLTKYEKTSKMKIKELRGELDE